MSDKKLNFEYVNYETDPLIIIKNLTSKLSCLSQYAGGLAMILIEKKIIDKKDIDSLNKFLDEKYIQNPNTKQETGLILEQIQGDFNVMMDGWIELGRK